MPGVLRCLEGGCNESIANDDYVDPGACSAHERLAPDAAAPLADEQPWGYSGNRVHPTEKAVSIVTPLLRIFLPAS